MKRSAALVALFSILAATAPAHAQNGTVPAGTKAEPPTKAAKKRPTRKKPAAAAPARADSQTVDPGEAAARRDVDRAIEKLQKDRAEVEAMHQTTLGLIRLMVEEGVLTKEKAMRLLSERDRAMLEDVEPRPLARDATVAPQGPVGAAAPSPEGLPEAGAAAGAPGVPGDRKTDDATTIRVPYVPEIVKDQIRDQIKQEVLAQAKTERWGDPNTLPEWMDRISFTGDFRLRYEGQYFSRSNASPLAYNAIEGTNLGNTQTDDGRWRYRLRFGVLARVTDTLGAGFRLVTGTTANPVSANVTLGQTSRFSEILLDRAYIRWDPDPRWSFSGGRIANPWFWPTALVWDEDLAFEGAAGSFKPTINDTTSAFVTAGVFPLQHTSPTPETPGPQTKWLYGVQGGGEWTPDSNTRLKLGAALFDFRNVEGRPNRDAANQNLNDWTLPQFRQKGNTVVDLRFNQLTPASASDYGLASKFRVLNLSAELALSQLDPFFVKVGADYVNNLGFDQAEVLARTGLQVAGETQGYETRVTVGSEHIREARDWQVFGGYRRIERNSVMDAFTDSNFWLGGTNAQGYFLGLLYGLDRNTWTRIRWLSANEISGPPLAIDTLQFDLNVRF